MKNYLPDFDASIEELFKAQIEATERLRDEVEKLRADVSYLLVQEKELCYRPYGSPAQLRQEERYPDEDR